MSVVLVVAPEQQWLISFGTIFVKATTMLHMGPEGGLGGRPMTDIDFNNCEKI